jgi:hypothetical protein
MVLLAGDIGGRLAFAGIQPGAAHQPAGRKRDRHTHQRNNQVRHAS